MANKRVNIDAGVRSASAHAATPRVSGTGQGSDGGKSGLAGDVSHLRPLSEGVLRAVGLHGGVDQNGDVRDLRAHLIGAEDLDPFELPSDELHVQWQRLEHEHQGMIERNVNANDMVVLRFVYGDGDVLTGKGATTREAFEALADKAGGIK